jgi:hypothetical protein
MVCTPNRGSDIPAAHGVRVSGIPRVCMKPEIGNPAPSSRINQPPDRNNKKETKWQMT